MLLTTERLQLKPARETDAAALFEILGDPAAMAFWDRDPYPRVQTVAALLAGEVAAMADGSARYWTVWRGDDAIGGIDISAIEQARGELGFLFRRDIWGQGFAREAVAAVIAHAFGPMGLERLAARVRGDNTPAIRLLEDMAFIREGILRGHALRGGVRYDSALFGRLRVQSINANGR